MATVHKSEKNNRRPVWTWLLVAAILGYVAFRLMRSHTFFSSDGMILMFIVSAMAARFAFNQFQANFSGFAGKDKTASFLGNRLPDSFHVLTSVPLVAPDGQHGFADAVVVGPNGVFVFVITNRNGTLSGGEDGDWRQDKVGQRGGEYTVTFKNPVKRLKRTVWLASSVCKQSGINAWVEGICYFSNSEAVVHTSSPHCFASEEAVIRHILAFQPRRPLNRQEVLNLTETFRERM